MKEVYIESSAFKSSPYRKRSSSLACGITSMIPIAQLWKDFKKVHSACRCFFK